MTLEEALEYLNLPANSRKQLIRKRYLELKKDYLKAIYNAPSDHFSTLYQENLQKIEEAYQFLLGEINVVNDQESQAQQTINQIQQVVNSFLRDRKVLDAESRQILKGYIDQIDRLTDSLKQESFGMQFQTESSHPPAWHWEVEQFKNASPTITLEPSPQENTNERVGLIQRIIAFVVGAHYMETTGSRKHLYDRFLMGIILMIAIMGILGTLYVMFPLFFS